MTAQKLSALLLGALSLIGPAAGVIAQEKKAEDKTTVETTPGKAIGKAKNANGTVKAATPDSLTVVGKGNKEWTFAVDSTTFIKKAGRSVVVTDLKEGDSVHVRYTETDGKLLAKSITVKGGGTAKKETRY